MTVTQLCPTLCDPWNSPWNSPGQNIGVGSLSLLQWIFPTQRSNPGLSHCSHKFSSVAQSSPTLCDPMNHSTPGLPVHHHSWSPPKPISIESVMPSNHLILCHPLLLLPSIFPSIRIFSNESALRIRWSKYWSFRFNMSSSNEHSGLISFRMDWLDLLVVRGALKSSPIPQFKSINSSALSFLYSATLTSIQDPWKNHSLDKTDLCWQSNVSAFWYAV